MHILCRKCIKFGWSSECETTLNNLSIAFTNPPVLQYPKVVLGAIMSNCINKVVAFASRNMKHAKISYPVIEIEL